jgi:hypothetical protein
MVSLLFVVLAAVLSDDSWFMLCCRDFTLWKSQSTSSDDHLRAMVSSSRR